MKLVVECEVCSFHYTIKTRAWPTADHAYIKMSIKKADLDCPNCGATEGRGPDNITADMVHKLWDEGLGGFRDIKRALIEAEGDMNLARELLTYLGRGFS